jgi:hypothetical protein
VPGLTIRYGRRSIGLGETLRAVALALGGRAGARLSMRLAATVSRMTLLRFIRAMPDPATGPVCPPPTPRKLRPGLPVLRAKLPTPLQNII